MFYIVNHKFYLFYYSKHMNLLNKNNYKKVVAAGYPFETLTNKSLLSLSCMEYLLAYQFLFLKLKIIMLSIYHSGKVHYCQIETID